MLEGCLHGVALWPGTSARRLAVRRKGQRRAAAPAVPDAARLQPGRNAALVTRRTAEPPGAQPPRPRQKPGPRQGQKELDIPELLVRPPDSQVRKSCGDHARGRQAEHPRRQQKHGPPGGLPVQSERRTGFRFFLGRAARTVIVCVCPPAAGTIFIVPIGPPGPGAKPAAVGAVRGEQVAEPAEKHQCGAAGGHPADGGFRHEKHNLSKKQNDQQHGQARAHQNDGRSGPFSFQHIRSLPNFFPACETFGWAETMIL